MPHAWQRRVCAKLCMQKANVTSWPRTTVTENSPAPDHRLIKWQAGRGTGSERGCQAALIMVMSLPPPHGNCLKFPIHICTHIFAYLDRLAAVDVFTDDEQENGVTN